MTPFNLEQALAGKPFTNHNGWTVEDWHYFKGAVTPISIKWKEAEYVYVYNESQLFMLPEKKKVWIVVYVGLCGDICTYAVSDEEYLTKFVSGKGTRYLETIEKEYEL